MRTFALHTSIMSFFASGNARTVAFRSELRYWSEIIHLSLRTISLYPFFADLTYALYALQFVSLLIQKSSTSNKGLSPFTYCGAGNILIALTISNSAHEPCKITMYSILVYRISYGLHVQINASLSAYTRVRDISSEWCLCDSISLKKSLFFLNKRIHRQN